MKEKFTLNFTQAFLNECTYPLFICCHDGIDNNCIVPSLKWRRNKTMWLRTKSRWRRIQDRKCDNVDESPLDRNCIGGIIAWRLRSTHSLRCTYFRTELLRIRTVLSFSEDTCRLHRRHSSKIFRSKHSRLSTISFLTASQLPVHCLAFTASVKLIFDLFYMINL